MDSSSGEIGSSFGGSSWTGTFGANRSPIFRGVVRVGCFGGEDDVEDEVGVGIGVEVVGQAEVYRLTESACLPRVVH